MPTRYGRCGALIGAPSPNEGPRWIVCRDEDSSLMDTQLPVTKFTGYFQLVADE